MFVCGSIIIQNLSPITMIGIIFYYPLRSDMFKIYIGNTYLIKINV